MEFSTVKDAKDFLANSITAEAIREGIPLSEIERKMLYFSESNWTPQEVETVNGEFDRDYNQDEYEEKIAGLVQKINARNHAEDPAAEEAWDTAAYMLAEGDHYLSILTSLTAEGEALRHPFIPTLAAPAVRPPHDRLHPWMTAIVVVAITLTAIGAYAWLSRR